MADILNSIIHSSDNAVNGLYNAMEIRRQRQQDARQGQMDQRNAMVQDRSFNEDVKAQAWGRAQSVILGGGTREQALSVLADASRQYGLPMPAPEVGDLLERSAHGSVSTGAGNDVFQPERIILEDGSEALVMPSKRGGAAVPVGLPPNARLAPQVTYVDGGNARIPVTRSGVAPGLPSIPVNVSPDQDPALKGAQRDAINDANISAIPEEAAANREQVRLDKQASAVSAIPLARETGGRALKVLGDIRTHPGLAGGTGFDWKRSKIPGTKEYDFAAKIRQAQGGAFLEARQALKGGGAITDIEGAKAEQALANLDQAQSAEAFMEALADYEGAIRRGFAILEQQAGRAPSDLMPVTNDPVQSFQQNLGSKLDTSVDLPVGTVRRGYSYQGGDPSKPESWKKQ